MIKAEFERVFPSEQTEIVRLKKEIATMQKSVDSLDCLSTAGVDNWSGYENAQEMYDEYEE